MARKRKEIVFEVTEVFDPNGPTLDEVIASCVDIYADELLYQWLKHHGKDVTREFCKGKGLHLHWYYIPPNERKEAY